MKTNAPNSNGGPSRPMSPSEREAAARRRAARRMRDFVPRSAYPVGPPAPNFGTDPALAPAAPTEVPLAVVTCHFNWVGYSRPRQNLRRFLREMDYNGIPVYGVEIVMPEQTSLMEGNPHWKVVEADPRRHLLWQKEAVLNLAAGLVPATVPFIAAVDADVRFGRRDWAALSVEALEQVPVIQPFGEAVWTDRDGAVELRRIAAACRGLPADWSAHPGFAWAFRRDFFSTGPGFYPWCITGAGDVALAAGLMGLGIANLPKGGALGIGKRNLANGIASQWMDAALDWMGGMRPGWIDGQIWHEWHGSRDDRRYLERHRLLENVEVGRHLRIDDDGLVAWTSRATEAMRRLSAEHFRDRREDGR